MKVIERIIQIFSRKDCFFDVRGQFGNYFVDPKYGGSGMDTISYVLIMEELSKIDASASVMVSVNNSLVATALKPMALKTKNKSI